MNRRLEQCPHYSPNYRSRVKEGLRREFSEADRHLKKCAVATVPESRRWRQRGDIAGLLNAILDLPVTVLQRVHVKSHMTMCVIRQRTCQEINVVLQTPMQTEDKISVLNTLSTVDELEEHFKNKGYTITRHVSSRSSSTKKCY